jgi:hypothetical protein
MDTHKKSKRVTYYNCELALDDKRHTRE